MGAIHWLSEPWPRRITTPLLLDLLLLCIYKLLAFKHCKGRRTKLALCEGQV
ncbi:hypothetical protein K2173_008145 [Erythroxylum novogranatense]|uniref:Uncharacterized protein n=1 Tax=Erythroxylum novogranatense TaxID=1862640 RepID=A0AAV8U8T6_9ROSI|nr:hypothetical protein K2173_008145 [Erythroxylum novogranatense]